MSDEMDSLLAQASRVGSFDSQGVFRVELARARGDLGKNFALAYPGHYGLKFVQAAVALQASSIQVSSKPKSLDVRFDCSKNGMLLVSAEGLMKVTDSVSSTAAVSLLLQAVWGALFDDAYSVILMLYLEGRSLCVTFDSRGVEAKDIPSKDDDQEHLEIKVLRRSRARSSEQKMLRERCGYCPVPLQVNRIRVDGTSWKNERSAAEKNDFKRYAPTGFRLAEKYLVAKNEASESVLGLPDFQTRGFRRMGEDVSANFDTWYPESDNVFCSPHSQPEGPYDGAVALPVELAGFCKMIPVDFGVTLEPILFQGPAVAGAIGVVNCARYGLRTDLYGFRVVDNEALKTARLGLLAQFHSLGRLVQSAIKDLRAKKRVRWTKKHQISFGVAATGFAIVSGGSFLGIAAGGVQILNSFMFKSGPDQMAEDNETFRQEVYRLLKHRR